MLRNTLGKHGLSIAVHDDGRHLAEASTAESLGFGTLWINGGQLGRLGHLTDLLAATTTANVASAIISPDVYSPADVTGLFQHAEATAPGRLVVGLGSSHGAKPLSRLNTYLDQMDSVPRDPRLLAALGPRALERAKDRFAGAMPGLFTAEHVAAARAAIGGDATLSVGLYAVLDDDATQARETARQPLSLLTTLDAYRNSLMRQGFSSPDIDGLSNGLVDAMVAWGSPRRIVGHAGRLAAAGADHVHFTVLGARSQPTGSDAARLLAAEFG